MQFITKHDFLVRVTRVRIRFEFRVLVDGGAAGAGTCGVTALDDEIRVDTVEDCSSVVVVCAVLEEVAGGVRGLGGEEGDVEGAEGCVESCGGSWVRFC